LNDLAAALIFTKYFIVLQSLVSGRFRIGSESLSVANLDTAYPFPKVPNQMLECRAGKSN
jgi:hypothetical protein